jgi:hypothetical protein
MKHGLGVEQRQFIIPLVNAGAPALIQRATMHWDEPGAALSPTTYEGTVTVLALAPGGGTDANFLFPPSEFGRLDRLEQQGKLWVEIAYTDASGGQPEVTRFDLYRVPGETPTRWRVWAVSFRRAGETEPYARAQPANR